MFDIACSEGVNYVTHLLRRAILYGLMQVKIGGGSDLDTEQVCELLTCATDSVCVHSVGFTLTLYRYTLITSLYSPSFDLHCCSRPQWR